VAWRDAIKETKSGCAIEVEVTPGSRASVFPAGYNDWRGRIEAKVRAPAEDGQANDELRRLVATTLGVPPARVSVTSGATARRKTLTVEGLAHADAVARLSATLGEGSE
jgi:hypothetical protein